MNWTWLITGLSIAGVILNIQKNRWCFVVWIGTNGAWCAVDLYFQIWSQAAMMAVYLALSVWGLWKWGREKRL